MAGRLFFGLEADTDDPTGVFFDGLFVFWQARRITPFGGLGGEEGFPVAKSTCVDVSRPAYDLIHAISPIKVLPTGRRTGGFIAQIAVNVKL